MSTTPKQEALATAVEIHRGRLRAFIRGRIRDQAEAEDVYQEVFVEFLEAYDLGVAIETLGAWLVRVAQNKILDRFRRQKTRSAYQEAAIAEAEGEAPEAPSPDDERVRRLFRDELASAVESLPPEQRQVWVMHELEGKSFEEIAAETGVNVNTLLSRKRYAVKALQEQLKETYDELE